MSGFADIIRTGVALANSLTSTLQVTIMHTPWIGVDANNVAQYGTPVARQAIVEYKLDSREKVYGEENLQSCTITFLNPIAANGAANRDEPIDPRDRMVLPDGTSGPLISVKGIVDPSTNKPYLYQVILGDSRQR